MKKTLIYLVLLFTLNVFSQNDYSKVMDLLIANKREEARSLFDKQFSKYKDQSIDLLFLDAMIDEELGRLNYDDSLIKKLEKLENSKFFIDPFINTNFVMGHVNESGYDELVYKKIDFLSQSKLFQNLDIVKYRKAISESKRLNHLEAKKYYSKLNVITDWQFCGVFENLNSSGLDTEYEPEIYAKNDKLFEANSNGKIGWYTPKNVQSDGYHFFYNEREYGSGIIFAQTFINVPENKEYILQFGTSSGIKIFIDDIEIATKYDTGKTNLNAFNYLISLDKGVHRLLIKVESSGSDYFSARILNKDLSAADELSFNSAYSEYSKSSLVNSEEIKLDFESYLEALSSKNPNNILYKFYLFHAYEANSKKELAHNVIEGLDEKFPKSSLISKYFIRYYAMDEEQTKVEEIEKNIENNDKEYYYATLLKIKDRSWLKDAPIKELEEYSKKSKKHISKYYSLMLDFMIASRLSNLDDMFYLLDDILKESNQNDKFVVLKASLYSSLKNDKGKYISILEDLISKTENFEAYNALINFYNDSNRKEDVKKLMLKRILAYPDLNFLRDSFIQVLINENNYSEALKYIDQNLENFPYSFLNFEEKATIYSLMKKNKDAEQFYLKALSHNSSNSRLRKSLYDLTGTTDDIETIETKNIYDVIKKRRNTSLKGDYGVTLLIDEFIVNVLPEGGRKSKSRFAYEITSESGIENLKEYNLDTYNVNLIKSEIIKKNGSLVPAEVSSNTLVFTKLEIGDVIYIEYDYYSNSYGRFYKDFNSSYTFNGAYPTVESIYTIIHPSGFNLNINVANGKIDFTEKKINNKIVKQWKKMNVSGLPMSEPFSPVDSDITNKVTVGTISSWKVIADWYSDLVKKNIKFDKVTQNAFNLIFPNGVNGLSENEKAEKIYKYICENITYSFLDFRQSGFVPQKPSKTISTKLGDCKDLSTLFVTLAEKAGLKSNLVLVLTNNNGFSAIPLPTNDFNHCIVRVLIDNKEVFLEMTDKYLPFKSLPVSLYKANALVIHFDKNQNSNLISIPFENVIKNEIFTKTIIDIEEDKRSYTNFHSFIGASKAYYNELFSSATTEDVRKKEFEEMYNDKMNKNVIFNSSKLLTDNIFDKKIEFETKFNVNEKLQQLGSLKIVEIPFLDQVYTKNVISKDVRNYPIVYPNYENVHEYISEIVLNIPNDKKFVEIPESKTLKYKNHLYSINYNLSKQNQLIVKRSVSLNWDNVETSDYSEYKKYVEEVLATEEQIVGYK